MAAEPASLDDLQRRALAGDAVAWDRLVAHWERRVLAFVLAKGVRPTRAREIVQETWMHLVQQQRAGKLERLDLPGLAIAQARFLVLDEHREAGRGPAHEVAEIDHQLPGPSAERELIQRDEVARMLRLLERCPKHKRQMFVMFYGQQRSAPSIAEELGVTVQHVRQSLYETRMELRAALEAP